MSLLSLLTSVLGLWSRTRDNVPSPSSPYADISNGFLATRHCLGHALAAQRSSPSALRGVRPRRPPCARPAARLAAAAAALPLIACPLEGLISKWYGEGEQKLAALFERCERIGPCILFLDEIDALGGTRDKEMHEASRRMLSTLLRHLDGFDAGKQIALIGATNRPNDLDAALISRFDVRVSFPAPDAAGRAMIFGRYAKQLTEGELRRLGHVAEGLSGRDILNVCKSAERRWVCDQLRERGDGLPYRGAGAVHAEMPLPPLRPYEEGIARYLEGMSVAVAPSPPAPGGAL